MNHNIIILGPSLDAKGGIVSVVKSLSYSYDPFVYVETTSSKSFIVNLITLVRAFFRFLYLMVFTKVDIVHVHSASYHSFRRKSIFINIAKIFNVKILVHMHGGSFKDFYHKNKAFADKTLIDDNVYVIALSESWKHFFETEMNISNIFVLPNPISFPLQFELIPNDKFRFLFLGKICREKGCFDLVEAIAEIKPYLEDKVEFRLAGLGEINELELFISEKGLENIVKCIGWVDGNDKQKEYAMADCFILPSYIEGLPIVILEAMSYKLPILATTIGGIPDVVTKEMGYLFRPGDIKGLKDGILAIMNLTEIERIEMGLKAYECSTSFFSTAVVENLKLIYDTVGKQR